MFGKRGLSDIVSTVLIVLLALAAVAIVWSFLRPIFESSGTNIQVQDLCLSSEVLPTKCEYYFDGANYVLTNAIIKHVSGSELKDLKAVLILDGEVTVVANHATPGLLGTYDFKDDLNTANTHAGVETIGLEAGMTIDDGAGGSVVCPQVSRRIECTVIDTGSECGDNAVEGYEECDCGEDGCSEYTSAVCENGGFLPGSGTPGCDGNCQITQGTCQPCAATCTELGVANCESNYCGLNCFKHLQGFPSPGLTCATCSDCAAFTQSECTGQAAGACGLSCTWSGSACAAA